MSAYYNEHDPFAAAWLRELIADGLIADGEVDERDIQTLDPADLAGYTQCHFFAGIGGWSLALRLAGWPDDRPVWTGSCPCQPFSSAGKSGGGAIRAIFGQRGIASSASAALQSSLVSRLKARLPTGGSTLFAMTWNEKATPSGRLVSLLQASALRTSDSGYGSLPTVTARDWRWGMSQANVERRKQHPRGVNLNEFMQRELGRPGRLNPGMVCLLMGFPTSWVKCAALVTPSSRKSRRHLSPPIKR